MPNSSKTMYTNSSQKKQRQIVRRFTQFAAKYPPARQRQLKLRSAVVAFLATIPKPHRSPVHAVNDPQARYRFVMDDLCMQFGAQTTIHDIIHSPALLQDWLETNR
jgi:hypothetical protein